MSLKSLEKEYLTDAGRFDALCTEIVRQIGELLKAEKVTLTSPHEFSIKSWASIVDKIRRYQLDPKGLAEIRDVAGIRIIVLFRRDLERIEKILETNLKILHKEDTFDRLSENQFGYGSIHYEVQPLSEWMKVPTLRKLEGLRAEIQVRTGSQHIWAAASHILQYKREAHVPPPLRRAISRVAALLESVDLEFERVLIEREQYSKEIQSGKADLPLNTELLKLFLDSLLPVENRDDEEGEDYADLLDDLLHFRVETTGQLKAILQRRLKASLQAEKEHVKSTLEEIARGEMPIGTSEERTERGVYFTHVGLTRVMLGHEFPKEFSKYVSSKGAR